jgi:hypothetical protein
MFIMYQILTLWVVILFSYSSIVNKNFPLSVFFIVSLLFLILYVFMVINFFKGTVFKLQR